MSTSNIYIPKQASQLSVEDYGRYFMLLRLLDNSGKAVTNKYGAGVFEETSLEYGEFMKSRGELAEMWGLTENKARHIIDKFIKLKLISVRKVKLSKFEQSVYRINFYNNDVSPSKLIENQYSYSDVSPSIEKSSPSKLLDNQRGYSDVSPSIENCGKNNEISSPSKLIESQRGYSDVSPSKNLCSPSKLSVDELLTEVKNLAKIFNEKLDEYERGEPIEKEIVAAMLNNAGIDPKISPSKLLENKIVGMGVSPIVLLYTLIINTPYSRINNIELSKTSFDDYLSSENILRDEKEELNSHPVDEIKKRKSKKEYSDDVEKIYKAYPTKCPVRGVSTGKSFKNKDFIERKLKSGEFDVDEMVRTIELYIAEVEREKFKQTQNFKTFLNNVPDYSDEMKVNKLQPNDSITSADQLEGLKNGDVLEVRLTPTAKMVELGHTDSRESRKHVSELKVDLKAGLYDITFLGKV